MLEPDDARIYEQKASIYVKQEKFENALKEYSKVIRLKPNDSNAYILRADLLDDMERYEEALDDYNTAIMLSNKPDETLFNSRGIVRGKLEQYDFALKDFEQALEIKRYYLPAIKNMGLAYLEKKLYSEALKQFNLALLYDNNSHEVYYFRAETYKKLGDFDSAVADYQKALEIYPDFDDAKKGLKESKKKLSKTSILKDSVQKDNFLKQPSDTPKKEIPSANQQKTTPKQFEYVQSEDYQSRKQTVIINSAKLRENLNCAEFCLYNNKKWEAIEYCREALKIDPNSEIAYSRLGVAYFQLGKYSEALNYYETAIKLNPNYAIAYCNIGVLKERTGDRATAIQYYKKSLEVNPALDKAREYLNNLQSSKKQRLKRQGGDFEGELE